MVTRIPVSLCCGSGSTDWRAPRLSSPGLCAAKAGCHCRPAAQDTDKAAILQEWLARASAVPGKYATGDTRGRVGVGE